METSNYRQFGLLMSGIIGAGFGILLPFVTNKGLSPVLLTIAGLFFAFAILWPVGLKPIFQIWMRLGHVLGKINTTLILFLFFFGILFPIGFLFRLIGRDVLCKKADPKATSYRVQSPALPRKNLEEPF